MPVLSPTVTRIPLLPRERTTARVFLQWPSVTKTPIFIGNEGSTLLIDSGKGNPLENEGDLRRSQP